MVVAFDCNTLALLLHPKADVPDDPTTGKPIYRAAERIEYLVQGLERDSGRIIVPAPAFSEFLTVASPEYLDEFNRSDVMSVAPFDTRAAIEAAAQLRKAMQGKGGKRQGLKSPWQKIKVDRQIVAIAKVEGASSIYTTDDDVIALARACGLSANHVAALPLPPSNTPLLDEGDEEV